MTGKKKLNFVAVIVIVLTLLIPLSSGKTQDFLVQALGLANDYSKQQENVLGANDGETYTVKRVVDGDTVELDNGLRVRYLNMDTPESVKPNTPVQCYAKEASEMNKAMVEGKEVVVKYDVQKQDKYGRDLVFVFLKGKNTDKIENNVNAQLVQMGYARAYIIKPNDTYQDEFYRLQREAQDNNLGVWKNCPSPFEK